MLIGVAQRGAFEMKLVEALSVGILVAVGLGLAGCGGGSKPMTPQCALNSDCAKLSTPGLVCALGYCVKPCNISSDCPSGERCIVLTASTDGGTASGVDAGVAQGTACQAPELATCNYNSMCTSPLVCSSDRQCRDMCETNVDCPGMGIGPGSQVCTSVTHLCADPAVDKDYNSTTNDFIVDGGAGGSGGSSGGAGKGGAGGGSGGAGGNHDAGAGGAGGGGAGGATPVNGDPCVTVDGGISAETIINEDQNHATPLTLGTSYLGCIQTQSDLDYFQFTVPTSSVQGGWLTVVVSNVAANMFVKSIVSTAADNGQIASQNSPNLGGNASLYLAGKPGTRFLALVQSWNGDNGVGPYTITASFQDDLETGEPNNLRAQATPLTLNTPFQGKFFAGYATSAVPTTIDWTDWFSIALTPGSFKVTLTNAPADIVSAIYFYDTQGGQLSSTFTNTPGGDLTLTSTIATAGTYYLSTVPSGSFPSVFGSGTTLPMWATATYTLTVAPAP
jgi:hypothetical protein